MLTRYACLALAALVIFGAGCGGPTRVPVSGTVTLNGQTFDDGTIRFEPTDGATATAEARIIAGKYSVDVAPGAKRVRIEGYKKVGEKRHDPNDPSTPMLPVMEPVVPAKYNTQSELTYQVERGSADANFELTAP